MSLPSVLIIGWLVGFFAFHAGGIIHALLVIALISIIVRVIQGRSVVLKLQENFSRKALSRLSISKKKKAGLINREICEL